MVAPRLEIGESDPVSYTCTCSAKQEGGGLVLLFYRYFANSPSLLGSAIPSPAAVQELAQWHEKLTHDLDITGKIRVATEGFNVTIGGTRAAIAAYMEACISHWSFAQLPLNTETEKKAFFKPSPGCACVFHPATTSSVRICSEITPLGITNYTPLNWDIVSELLPAEFHRRCHEEKIELLDLRNHYESRIGYFIDPVTGQKATTPQIRRFSQVPQLVASGRLGGDALGEKQVLTYCTGGIRCEKATRWIAERDGEKRKICTLKGGIQAYLDWIDEEVNAGRKRPEESLFKGKNYVFDARGAVGMKSEVELEPVSSCHCCGALEDRLSKCASQGCHLVLVICDDCERKDPRCCESCKEMADKSMEAGKLREMCECEKMRELELWGDSLTKTPKTQGWRKARRKGGNIEIQMKVIE